MVKIHAEEKSLEEDRKERIERHWKADLSILEIMLMDDTLGREVVSHADAGRLRQVAREAGAASMREDGLRKALAGVTTVEEVERATREG